MRSEYHRDRAEGMTAEGRQSRPRKWLRDPNAQTMTAEGRQSRPRKWLRDPNVQTMTAEGRQSRPRKWLRDPNVQTMTAEGRQSRPRKWLRDPNAQTMILVAAAFGVRLLAGWLTGQLPHPQPLEYEWIARNILAGKGFVYEHLGTPYRAFVPPGYPLLCTAVYAVTKHSQTALLLLQCFISALTCRQVSAIGLILLKKPKLALWAGWLTAAHPGLIIYATKLHPLTTDLFTYLWALWAWLKLFQEPTVRRSAHAGLASGTALFCRGTIGYFIPLAAFFFLWEHRKTAAAAARTLLPAILLTVALASPWLVRNYIHFGKFPLYMTTSGELLWRGNNPLASGSALRLDGKTVLGSAPEPFRQEILRRTELEQNKFFFEAAKRFMIENPLWALKLYAKKWVYFWTFSPQEGLWYPRSYSVAYTLFYSTLLALAAAGAWTTRRLLVSREGALCLCFILCISLTQSLFYVEGRHRWTVEPLILILSAAGLAEFFKKLFPQESPGKA